MRQRIAGEWAVFLIALGFLTRLPIPGPPAHTRERLAAAPRWFPAVGAVIGIATALVYLLCERVLPPVLAALLSTAAGLLLTGCFHEDGFADVCDGLGGGATAERALAIMRDSRLGTYGAAGLGLMLGGKILTLGSLPAGLVPVVLVTGHVASRTSCVVVMATSRYVRGRGTGTPVSQGVGAGGIALALGTALAAFAGLALAAGWPVLGAVLGLALGHGLMRSRFERRLGGYTGDCLGAVQQASEIGCYLGLLAWL